MIRNTIVTLQDVTEQDLRDAFYQAIEELGVKAGDQIPADMYNLREQVIDILFRPVVPTKKEDIFSCFKESV